MNYIPYLIFPNRYKGGKYSYLQFKCHGKIKGRLTADLLGYKGSTYIIITCPYSTSQSYNINLGKCVCQIVTFGKYNFYFFFFFSLTYVQKLLRS